jgi:hypothetical protein
MEDAHSGGASNGGEPSSPVALASRLSFLSSFMRSGSASSNLTPQCPASPSDTQHSGERSFKPKPLKVDRDFVEIALVMVPDTLADFHKDHLAAFLNRFPCGQDFPIDVTLLYLGQSLFIFSEDVTTKDEFKWVFWTDNALNKKLFALLSQIASPGAGNNNNNVLLTETVFRRVL